MIRTTILPIEDMFAIGPCTASAWAWNTGAKTTQNEAKKEKPCVFVASASPIIDEMVHHPYHDRHRGYIEKTIEKVKGIDPDGYVVLLPCHSHDKNRQTSYRPAIANTFKIDEKNNTIRIDKYTLPLRTNSEGQTYFELGAYPQECVSEQRSRYLTGLQNRGILIETGNSYTSADGDHPEIQVNGHRYVNAHNAWHEVTPIRWIVDGNKVYADQALLGNLPFPEIGGRMIDGTCECFDGLEDYSYTGSYICKFLKKSFDKQMMQSYDFVMREKERSAADQELETVKKGKETPQALYELTGKNIDTVITIKGILGGYDGR